MPWNRHAGAAASAIGPAASAARAARDEEDLSGATLPPCYYLESRHAEGGMGVIYRARHLYLDRTCAVKVPRAPTSSEERRRLRDRINAASVQGNPMRAFLTRDADFFVR